MILTESSQPREEYRVAEIRIFPSADAGATYPVELEIPTVRSFPPGIFRLDTSRLAERAADPRAYGRALGELIFAGEALGDALQETLAAFAAQQGALRFRLRIDPPELYTLAWERLLAPIDGSWLPLTATAATPFSRYVLAQDWDMPKPVTGRPLRMLVVIASPNDLDQFELDPISADERQALHTLLDGLPDLSVTYLESGTATPPTMNALRTALADGYHIVHFLCHGASTPRTTALYLEDEAGQVEVAIADRLLEAFKLVQTPPLLCFLAACESAARGRHDAFVPLGPALVERSGILAVIAMSDRVGIETARLVTGQFYSRLLNHGLADLAMNEARALVQDQADWGVPVLFCRLNDSQIVDFPAGQAIASIEGVATTMNSALETARLHDEGAHLIAELERLLAAFKTTFQILVDFGTRFRAVGSDTATFSQSFEPFYVDFKAYYDQETFDDEQALLRQMTLLKFETLPKLRPLLSDKAFMELQEALDQMAINRAGLIEGFGDYLEPMNTAVDEIKGLLVAGDVTGAITRKLAFETQISPSLRRSKELIHNISTGITQAQAA